MNVTEETCDIVFAKATGETCDLVFAKASVYQTWILMGLSNNVSYIFICYFCQVGSDIVAS